MSIRPPSGTPAGGAPTAHAASHASGGSDPVTLAESQVTGLAADLAALAPLASPALTGNPTAPTQSAGNNSTRLANTAYVDTASGLLVPKSLLTTKGDIIAASGSATAVRVPVGADGTVLTADAASTGGVKFATAGGGSAVPTDYLAPSPALFETVPRWSYLGNLQGLNSGGLCLAAIALPAGLVVSKIGFSSASSAAVSPTHWWFGLYDSTLHQLAVTADQTTTAWSSATVKTLNIATTAAGAASSFTTTYSGLHYIGIMMTASTMVNLLAAWDQAQLNVLAPTLTGNSDTGQTTPPGFPHTAIALSSTRPLVYGFVG